MTRTRSKRLVFLAWAGCLLCLAGCGGGNSLETAAVSGFVTLNGKPLVDGVIRFVPVSGTPGPKLSIPVKDGLFEAASSDGPSVGKHRIEIESLDTGGYALDDEDAIDRLQAERKRRIAVDKVPAKYSSRTSVLSAEVSADNPNEFTFELSSKK